MRILALFILLLSLNASAKECPWTSYRDILMTRTEDFLGSQKILSKDEMLTDLDCLRLLFKYQYAGTEVYASRGIDLLERLSTLEKNLQDNVATDDFMKSLFALHQDAGDRHFGYYFYNTFTDSKGLRHKAFVPGYIDLALWKNHDGYVPAGVLRPGMEMISCDQMTVQKVLDDKGRVNKLMWFGHFEGVLPKTVSCILKNGQKKRFFLTAVVPNKLDPSLDEFHFEILPEGYIYVRIPHYYFPGQIPQTHLDFLSFLESLKQDLPVIIDLRGGGGGDPMFAWEVARRFITKNEKIPPVTGTTMESSLSFAGLASLLFEYWKLSELRNEMEDAARFEAGYKKFSQLADDVESLNGFKHVNVLKEPYPDLNGVREAEYTKPIIVLIDKDCGSACEGIPVALRRHPKAVFMGSNTGGYIRFGSPGNFRLPNSQVVFYGGYFALDAPDHPEEFIGYAPKLYHFGQDTLQAAKRYLNRNHW